MQCERMAAHARIIRRNGRPRTPCRECAKAYGFRRRAEGTGRDGTIQRAIV